MPRGPPRKGKPSPSYRLWPIYLDPILPQSSNPCCGTDAPTVILKSNHHSTHRTQLISGEVVERAVFEEPEDADDKSRRIVRKWTPEEDSLMLELVRTIPRGYLRICS